MTESDATGEVGYQQLLDDLGVGVVVVALDGRILESNHRARELLPMPDQFAGELSVYEAVLEITDEQRKPVSVDDLPVARAFRDGRSVPGTVLGFRVKHADAAREIVWLLVAARLVRDERGEASRAVTTFVDITDQRIAREEVLASEDRFRLLAENAADLIYRFRVEPELQFEYVNPAFSVVLGYEPEEYYADPELALRTVHADDRPMTAALTPNMLESEVPTEVRTLVVRMMRRDGTMLWAEHRIVPVVESGRVVAFEGIARDVTALKEMEADLSHRASHDPLTGLPNRVGLLDSLERGLARTRSGGGALAVLYVDLDRFKTVNDNLGHDAGDRVLGAVARRIADAVRPSDSVARLGGDEFAAVLPGLRDTSEAEQVAERVLAALQDPVSLDDSELVTTASIGVAFTDDGNETPAELLRRADLAMYAAKDRGRARVERYG